MVRAILFDFDGVLTLDETGSQSICKYICAATGIDRDVFTKTYRKYNADLLTGKLKHAEIWEKVCNEVEHQITIDILHDSFVNTPINVEMLKIAQKLKADGYKIGMVTDNKADRIKSIVEYHQWDSMFDGIVVSAEVGSGKDQAEIFLSIFQKLSVAPDECIFIDNKEENLIVPKSLGVTTVFYEHEKNGVPKLKKEFSVLGIQI